MLRWRCVSVHRSPFTSQSLFVLFIHSFVYSEELRKKEEEERKLKEEQEAREREEKEKLEAEEKARLHEENEELLKIKYSNNDKVEEWRKKLREKEEVGCLINSPVKVIQFRFCCS